MWENANAGREKQRGLRIGGENGLWNGNFRINGNSPKEERSVKKFCKIIKCIKGGF